MTTLTRRIGALVTVPATALALALSAGPAAAAGGTLSTSVDVVPYDVNGNGTFDVGDEVAFNLTFTANGGEISTVAFSSLDLARAGVGFNCPGIEGAFLDLAAGQTVVCTSGGSPSPAR